MQARRSLATHLRDDLDSYHARMSQEMIRQVNEEIQFSKREVQMLRQEKEQLENVLSHKSTEVRKNLQVEAER